jgi:hypothetical protein
LRAGRAALGVLKRGGHSGADPNAVAQRSRDERMVGITALRVRGQQDLSLEPKMSAPVLLPVVRERRARVARGVDSRALSVRAT